MKNVFNREIVQKSLMVLSVFLTGIIDYVFPRQLPLMLLYMFPIAIATWLKGGQMGYTLSVIAAIIMSWKIHPSICLLYPDACKQPSALVEVSGLEFILQLILLFGMVFSISRLHLTETRFNQAFHSSAAGMAIVSLQGEWLSVNHALCIMLGYTSAELSTISINGITLHDDIAKHELLREGTLSGSIDDYRLKLRLVHADGEVVWVLLSAAIIRDQSKIPKYFVVQLQDISDLKIVEDELRFTSTHDSLTGLLNRSKFNVDMSEWLYKYKNEYFLFALISVDLDRFKFINDNYGHPVGDYCLRVVSERMKSCIRKSDRVYRYGGDEFMILVRLKRCKLETIQEVCSRIQAAIAEPIQYTNQRVTFQFQVGSAIGVALPSFNNSMEHAQEEELITHADIALYKAKGSEPGSRWQLYDDETHRQSMLEFSLMSELSHAISLDQLFLEYQPIYDLATNEISGCEALVRWQHPTHGLIPPSVFIPLAERNPIQIDLINEWVLCNAACEAATWNPPPGFRVSVNLNSVTLQDSLLIDRLQEILKHCEIDGSLLTVEVTESSLFEAEQTGRTLNQLIDLLHGIQVQVDIDDFGTGYSNLQRLMQLPADGIKIDRQFIAAINEDIRSASIVEAAINLAQNLGMTVVAEGVETVEQLTRLKDLGCTHAQGYLLGRPAKGNPLDR
jgi:diguanylate cyclase (GGDEF)-like protein/PAS domain S-box-containing protein